MAKVCMIILVLLVATSVVMGLDNNCPLSSKMTSCSPKCKDDSECFGRKCCPNVCNAKSCVPEHLRDSNKSDGYKNQNAKSATGSYCGNVKCNAYEKCEIDKSTKRQRCMRQ
ncbi:WAP, Kazal, immunoglobulin, Kunitz and NTR domain-containing protein 2 [Sitophilus oryzae]|uniref:WAP, Kazal, immunoglobulin, Kunitz and NTR domain-containing protein 2 n=1 Tax=Sitophilus oryzae TaxID=7048 RepID=A0A6J2Y0U5_SITOR|nr:WAP, Kazal, immunoglobulin, Kunitz and NTR domain-containing protein 2 [Sitophilus oryzae]